jgi:tetratricopeptide (TPR) repeat protein
MNRQELGIGSALDIALVGAFQAYRQGLLRQPQRIAPIPPRDFDALKFLGTVGWVPLEERLHVHKLHLACGKGLSASRQGCLDEALDHYDQAKQQLDRLEGSQLAWLLGVSTYEAGIAYMDFRHGCIERAQESLNRAMNADLQLERAGLPVMQMHRIQQGHNLARMDLRLGRREVAIKLGGMLFAYLEHRVEVLPYHRDWNSKLLQAVPRSLLQAMIHQIIGETAGSLVTGAASVEEWRVLIEACRLCRDPETTVFPQVQYALQAQHERLKGTQEEYLHNLERFFRFGIRDCHLLWYAIMIEFVNFCGELDTRRSWEIRGVILRDSAKWKGLPLLLRNRLNTLGDCRAVA